MNAAKAGTFFEKKVKNPFLGSDITIYADLPAASFFHNVILMSVLDGIRTDTKDITNEDNNIEIYLRMVALNIFRITYRLSKDDKVKALMLQFMEDKNSFIVYVDPLI